MPVNCPNCGFKLGVTEWGGWTLDENKRILVGLPKVSFVAAELRLLSLLLEAKGEMVDRDKCAEACARLPQFKPEVRIVDTTISRIRARLRPYNLDPIETVRGVGYRIKPKENANA